MISIKNYFDQQQELNTALLRMESLKEKKEMYFQRTQPKATVIKDTIPGTDHVDVMSDYVIKIEKIDKEIEMLEKEIEITNKYLNKIEECLRKMKDPLVKIFVCRYIDDLSVVKTAMKVNYSPSDVYRKLSIIRKIINDKK